MCVHCVQTAAKAHAEAAEGSMLKLRSDDLVCWRVLLHRAVCICSAFTWLVWLMLRTFINNEARVSLPYARSLAVANPTHLRHIWILQSIEPI